MMLTSERDTSQSKQPYHERHNTFPNTYISVIIASSITIGEISVPRDLLIEIKPQQLRTELDSHANMSVVWRNCFVINYMGETVDVNPFTPDYKSLKEILLVDTELLYICEYTRKEALLILRNSLHTINV